MYNSSFHLPSERFLFKKLGQYDAMVEFLECSVRTFLQNYDSKKENFNQFLSRASENVSIYLRSLSLENYKSSIVMGYLILPYSCFEEYLTLLRDDIRNLIDKEFNLSNKDDKTKLEKLILSLKKKDIDVNIPKENYSLFEYYRLIRNYVAHGGEKNKIESIYSKINLEIINNQFPKLTGPNRIDKINFDDFILATANLKFIAGLLTKIIEEHVDWIKLANNKFFKKHKKLDKDSKFRYIKNSIKFEYGILIDDKICNKIICSLE